jgi:Ca-activated chloride channel family protein
VIAEFQLLRPWWLAALLPWTLLVMVAWRRRARSHAWARVCDEALLPWMLESGRDAGTRRALLALLLGGWLALLALAGPAWERAPQPLYRNERPLVALLDLSASMDAGDVAPSRLVRARYKLADILHARDAGRAGLTALVVFAADAFTVTPLTDDTDTILAMLPALSPQIMPVQGSRPDRALSLAAELLAPAGRSGDVLLLTDEAGSAADFAAVERLRTDGHRLSVFAIGTPGGAPIPMPQAGGFLRDDAGRIVIPALEPVSLEQLARAGDGMFMALTANDTDVTQLLAFLASNAEPSRGAAGDRRSDQWREEGPWLLLGLIPLAALAFRRGLIAVAVLCVGNFLTPPTHADEPSGLWLRPDQRAARLLADGEPQQAASLFEDRRWRAIAEYRAGDYEAAISTLQGLADADSHYNRGNALARRGNYEEAVAAYEQALALDPAHDDARYNRDLLRKMSDPNSGQQQPQQSAADQQEQSGGRSTADDAARGAGEHQDDESPPQDNRANDREGTQPDPATAQESGEQDGDAQLQAASPQQLAPDEEQQANEQWLRSIPDDPGGLLRRKFYYQSRQRAHQPPPDSKPW